jgi:predicted HAD superfamily Cof-like phosphohydrolase
MKKQIEQVKEFNKVFGIEHNNKPTLISRKKWSLREELMYEELNEYYAACMDRSLTEVADALGDMLYILCGTILAHGMQDKITEVFNEIHRSNMSKIEDGVVLRREDGKVLKGKNYFKPNINQILNK